MTERRKALLFLLVPLFLLPLGAGYLGGFGSVEAFVWIALVAIWLLSFVFWGRRPQPH